MADPLGPSMFLPSFAPSFRSFLSLLPSFLFLSCPGILFFFLPVDLPAPSRRCRRFRRCCWMPQALVMAIIRRGRRCGSLGGGARIGGFLRSSKNYVTFTARKSREAVLGSRGAVRVGKFWLSRLTRQGSNATGLTADLGRVRSWEAEGVNFSPAPLETDDAVNP